MNDKIKLNTKTYQRKREIWFGTEEENYHFDLTWKFPIQFYLEESVLHIKQGQEAVSIFLNGRETVAETLTLKEGDTLELSELAITFFKEKLEIYAQEGSYKTSLLPVKGEEAYFEGFPYYKRSPRVAYRIQNEVVEIMNPPKKKEMSKGSLAQIIIPPLCMMALTIAMGVFMNRDPYIYMTAGMTAITLIFSIQKYITEKRAMRQDNKARDQMYDEYLLNTRKKLRRLRSQEREAMDYQNPSLSMLQDMVLEYSSRVYERTVIDDDFLKVNVGFRRGESQVQVTFQNKELEIVKDELIENAKRIPREYGTIERIPVEIDLKRAHLGLVGSKRNIHEQLKYMLAQLTFFQSYHDLQIVFIHSEAYRQDFEYMRWYPHLRLHFINVIGEIYTEQIRDQILGSIQQLLKDRKLKMEEGERKNLTFQIQHTEHIRLEDMARALCALIHEQGITSKVPEKLSFFEMYHVNEPKELDSLRRWQENSAYKSLAVPIGARAEEDFVELNLHEKAHGPHGLMAGTTGSGKSETVQTYILSLAVNFHPHEVGFLLIDYKGGGMANLFAHLPHLLGTITNLDKQESMRAMASIKSELGRRQRIFGEFGVNHINDYNKLFRMGKAKEPLPHLLIISDEFAELKKEQPEFMAELDSASRIGRSLGVHLILATQKPSGVVDAQVWSNSKFRICLKVQNAADSKEMLHTADAANITQSGRGFLQVGNNEIYEMFQSAWSGAPFGSKEEQREEDDRVYLLNALGQGESLNRDLSGSKEAKQLKQTQLAVVVSYLQTLYEAQQAVPVKKTWLPPLPLTILSPYTQDVKDSKDFEALDLRLGVGKMDIPEEQRQQEYILDMEKNGHMLYLASAGYGKSVLLTQCIIGMSMKNSVSMLNFYILDLGNSGLIPLKQLPHVADYMGFDDGEKIGKFQKMILSEIDERKRKLAKAMVQNFSVYNETQEKPFKAIILVIDQYDVIKELGEAVESFVQKVSRDGVGLGIYLLVTTTRDNTMRSATRNNFKVKIGGYNFDESETNAFIGRSQQRLSQEQKGRALVKMDAVHTMQLYVPVLSESEKEYNSKLKALISKIEQASTQERAKEIPVMPQELLLSMLHSYPGYELAKGRVPVGIDVDSLEVYYLNMVQTPAFVLGNAKTGKTNVIQNLISLAGENEIHLFDGKNRGLAGYQTRENVHYADSPETIKERLSSIREEILSRKEAYEEARVENVSLPVEQFLEDYKAVYVMVDMLQELYESLEEDNSWMDILEEAVHYGFYVIATSEFKVKKMTKSKFINLLLASREALILGNIKEQILFSYTGIREENRKVEFGYYHNAGENHKVKLISCDQGL